LKHSDNMKRLIENGETNDDGADLLTKHREEIVMWLKNWGYNLQEWQEDSIGGLLFYLLNDAQNLILEE